MAALLHPHLTLHALHTEQRGYRCCCGMENGATTMRTWLSAATAAHHLKVTAPSVPGSTTRNRSLLSPVALFCAVLCCAMLAGRRVVYDRGFVRGFATMGTPVVPGVSRVFFAFVTPPGEWCGLRVLAHY